MLARISLRGDRDRVRPNLVLLEFVANSVLQVLGPQRVGATIATSKTIRESSFRGRIGGGEDDELVKWWIVRCVCDVPTNFQVSLPFIARPILASPLAFLSERS